MPNLLDLFPKIWDGLELQLENGKTMHTLYTEIHMDMDTEGTQPWRLLACVTNSREESTTFTIIINLTFRALNIDSFMLSFYVENKNQKYLIIWPHFFIELFFAIAI